MTDKPNIYHVFRCKWKGFSFHHKGKYNGFFMDGSDFIYDWLINLGFWQIRKLRKED